VTHLHHPLIFTPPAAGKASCCNPPTLSCLGTGIKYAGLHTQEWLHTQWHG